MYAIYRKTGRKRGQKGRYSFLSWTLQYEKEMGKWTLSLWGHTLKRM